MVLYLQDEPVYKQEQGPHDNSMGEVVERLRCMRTFNFVPSYLFIPSTVWQ